MQDWSFELSSLKENIRRFLPSTVRPRRIVGGPLSGNYLVTSWHDYPSGILGRAEPALIDWLRRSARPGDTWLDLGAHYGYTTLALCQFVGGGGRVFAFEPLLTTVGYLAATRSVNHLAQLTVVPFAVGDNEEITPVSVSPQKGMAQPKVTESEGRWLDTVYCVALDKIWHRLCGSDETISGIKMDVEGMEIEVLKGMIGILHKHRPKLVIEVHVSRGVHLASLTRVLREAGYASEGHPIEKSTEAADKSYEFAC
jgi:FkbM family methyltransferase